MLLKSNVMDVLELTQVDDKLKRSTINICATSNQSQDQIYHVSAALMPTRDTHLQSLQCCKFEISSFCISHFLQLHISSEAVLFCNIAAYRWSGF